MDNVTRMTGARVGIHDSGSRSSGESRGRWWMTMQPLALATVAEAQVKELVGQVCAGLPDAHTQAVQSILKVHPRCTTS